MILLVERNFDPGLHPFEAAREYTRALNATKLERVFAKPFLGALDGHKDVITALALPPKQLSLVYTAAADGEIRSWRATTRRCVRSRRHGTQGETAVKGMCFNRDGTALISVGVDGVINRWDIARDVVIGEDEDLEFDDTPTDTILTKV